MPDVLTGEKPLDGLLHENEVMKRYSNLFAERELREARQEGKIEWFDLRKGPHYTVEQLMAYLELRKVKPCDNAALTSKPNEALENGKPNASFKSTPSGSATKAGANSSSIIGMTKQLEERAARRLDSET